MLMLNFKHRCTPPKVQNYHKGSALLAVVLILAVISSLMSVGTAKITQAAISSTGSNKITLQAQQYAAAEAELLKSVDYNELQAQEKTNIENSGYNKEITISDETDYSDTIKQKTATVKIYNSNESLPRAKLKVTRYNAKQASGVPIGTVIAWASQNNPADGTWLDCNGQSCASYSELVAVLGKSTVPDYRGRFLEGSTTVGIVKEAGLPNITGAFSSYELGGYSEPDKLNYFKGAFGVTGESLFGGSKVTSDSAPVFDFDASRCSAVYGKSDTVQPPAVTVRYLIKAA